MCIINSVTTKNGPVSPGRDNFMSLNKNSSLNKWESGRSGTLKLRATARAPLLLCGVVLKLLIFQSLQRVVVFISRRHRTRLIDIKRVAIPRLAALFEADNPTRKEAARYLPRVARLIAVGNEAATGNLANDEGGGVDDTVSDDTGDETVGNRVGEGHGNKGNEGGNSIACDRSQ